MPTVEIDIIEESSLKRTVKGYEKTRVAMVSGLTGSAADRELEAMTATGIPTLGTTHPTITSIRVAELDAKADGPTLVRVKILYRTPSASGGSESIQVGDPTQLEISGSIEMATTDVDKDGNLLVVGFAGDSNDPAINDYVAEVQFPRAHGMIRFSRREAITATQAQTLVDTYVGRTNNATLGPFATGTLLMARIICRSDDGGSTFIVSYEMAHERNTWKARIKAVNPETGKIPAGITLDDGLIIRELVGSANFSTLSL